MLQLHTYSLTLSAGFDFQYVCNANDKKTLECFAGLFIGEDLSWFLQYGDMHSITRLRDKQEIMNFLKS